VLFLLLVSLIAAAQGNVAGVFSSGVVFVTCVDTPVSFSSSILAPCVSQKALDSQGLVSIPALSSSSKDFKYIVGLLDHPPLPGGPVAPPTSAAAAAAMAATLAGTRANAPNVDSFDVPGARMVKMNQGGQLFNCYLPPVSTENSPAARLASLGATLSSALAIDPAAFTSSSAEHSVTSALASAALVKAAAAAAAAKKLPPAELARQIKSALTGHCLTFPKDYWAYEVRASAERLVLAFGSSLGTCMHLTSAVRFFGSVCRCVSAAKSPSFIKRAARKSWSVGLFRFAVVEQALFLCVCECVPTRCCRSVHAPTASPFLHTHACCARNKTKRMHTSA
jgi:hypothetical protein